MAKRTAKDVAADVHLHVWATEIAEDLMRMDNGRFADRLHIEAIGDISYSMDLEEAAETIELTLRRIFGRAKKPQGGG
jgi:hypothetical protein